MIVMLDTPQDLMVCETELNRKVEELFTPLTRRNPKRPDKHFAMDNGAYSRFDMEAFLTMLEKHEPRKELCRFVAMPDVVCCARRTLEAFEYWHQRLADDKWPLAFVCQDGQEDLPIPWSYLDAIFIGGSTEWKTSIHAAHIVRAAKTMGKWVHIGRINGYERFEYFEELGADSCDGTGLAQYSHMRKKISRIGKDETVLMFEST